MEEPYKIHLKASRFHIQAHNLGQAQTSVKMHLAHSVPRQVLDEHASEWGSEWRSEEKMGWDPEQKVKT